MNKNNRLKARVWVTVSGILVLLTLALMVFVGLPLYQQYNLSFLPATPTYLPVASSPVVEDTPVANLIALLPTSLPSPQPLAVNQPDSNITGLLILSLRDGNFAHLFAFHPQSIPLTRLTNSPWDDVEPAISPDGAQIAFSSKRNGYWDIYILDIPAGQISQVTDTPAYDGSPTWSPDGKWLAYETYLDDNLEIVVSSLGDLQQPPIRLTNDSAADTSPRWSPLGREIAFISGRSGNETVWVAYLDQADNRFIQLGENNSAPASFPAWSPDGRYLAWGTVKNGADRIFIWDHEASPRIIHEAGTGLRPVWSPLGSSLVTEVRTSKYSALSGFALGSEVMMFPIVHLPGSLMGLDWKSGRLPDALNAFLLPPNATAPVLPVWSPALDLRAMPPGGRFGMVPLADTTAPYPYLQDAVDDAFDGLRIQVGQETGWDFLSSLENAYIPLTEPPGPNMEDNWLFTGRAFAANPLPLQAGWMAIVQENIEGQTYWRMYLKARFQDGSQGRPLSRRPWDLNARYTGSPKAYEQGGELGAIPSGYWVDFTELAYRYGWDRLPSLTNWRSYYPSIRFNQYVITDGLDWNYAMAEIYPPEALVTPTLQPTPTTGPTRTPETPQPIRTATTSPTVTLTPTLHPTWTPLP